MHSANNIEGVRREYNTFITVLNIKARMHILASLALGELAFDKGAFALPDNFLDRREVFKRHIKGDTTYLQWNNGDCLRIYFDEIRKGYPNYCSLNDAEFAEFMTDSFSPHKERFLYSFCYEAMILTSVGPDGVRDINISNFNTKLPYWGLGESVVDNVYDPTNGILSKGDIIYPPGIVFCLSRGESARDCFQPLEGKSIPCF